MKLIFQAEGYRRLMFDSDHNCFYKPLNRSRLCLYSAFELIPNVCTYDLYFERALRRRRGILGKKVILISERFAICSLMG